MSEKANRSQSGDGKYTIGPYTMDISAVDAMIGNKGDVETLTAAKTLLKSDMNRIYVLNNAAAFAVNLPAISNADAGLWAEFWIQTTVTSVGSTIVAQTGDLLEGFLFLSKATDYVVNMAYFAADESNDLTITQNGTTTGGLIGSKVRVQANNNGYWTVSGIVLGSSTLATPFS